MAGKDYGLYLIYTIDSVEQTRITISEYLDVDLSSINPETLIETLLGLVPAGVSQKISSLSSIGGFIETLLQRAGLIP